MSRVDLIKDGERIAAENFSDPEDVTISFDGGETQVLKLARWEHVVIEIDGGDE